MERGAWSPLFYLIFSTVNECFTVFSTSLKVKNTITLIVYCTICLLWHYEWPSNLNKKIKGHCNQ